MSFFNCLRAAGLRSPFEIENAKQKKKAYAVRQKITTSRRAKPYTTHRAIPKPNVKIIFFDRSSARPVSQHFLS
jgi:hypothetical protein